MSYVVREPADAVLVVTDRAASVFLGTLKC
nr:MAG TPA: hypothetical protein [Caudoviricetes sp.]